jgi:hypothetical protein
LGDVFVEMDHDDILPANTFSELAAAFTTTPNGFYYSDFINVLPNGRCETYNSNFGWQAYRCTVDGTDYTACRAFPPTARAMCHIFYAPNHIRAWSRTAYELSGGHDEHMVVGDDHDLVCRTYISKSPFVYIDKPLYIYRRWPSQSYLRMNDAIQVQQKATCDKYLRKLVETECVLNDWVIWTLSPNTSIIDSVVDNSVGCFEAFDYLQSVPRSEVIPLMNALYASLRPGGWLLTSTPSICDSENKLRIEAIQAFDCRSHWTPENFDYFCIKANARQIGNTNVRFQRLRSEIGAPADKYQPPYLHVDLCALKGQRQPGASKI